MSVLANFGQYRPHVGPTSIAVLATPGDDVCNDVGVGDDVGNGGGADDDVG